MADTETKADIRGAVRELFPKIPEADLDSIVNHAFEEVPNPRLVNQYNSLLYYRELIE